jgi:DNA modification methylase
VARKPGTARGCPEGTGSNVCGSVPWEGSTRNKRSVWNVATQPFKEAHFATFPPALIEPCILAGSRAGDVVLDPYMGAGTTGLVAQRLGRRWIGCELNPDYAAMAERRIAGETLGLPLEAA